MARQEEAANEDGEQGAAKKRKANDGNAVAEGEGPAAEEKSPNAESEEETAEESSKKTKSEEEEKVTDEKKEETIEDGFWSKIPSSRAFLSTVSVDKNEVEVSHRFAFKLTLSYLYKASFSRLLYTIHETYHSGWTLIKMLSFLIPTLCSSKMEDKWFPQWTVHMVTVIL
jgi:hypothetical protein